MLYKRIISDKLYQLAQNFPAVVLTGARQVGKTTLLKEMFPDHSYVSLDSYQNADLAENNPQRFLSQFPR
ncbi:MAG: AAA family ATPase, partial [Bdellovibrionales bacterium]|nr:AAA family ATPase [Bdellovibrionales bacterium]